MSTMTWHCHTQPQKRLNYFVSGPPWKCLTSSFGLNLNFVLHADITAACMVYLMRHEGANYCIWGNSAAKTRYSCTCECDGGSWPERLCVVGLTEVRQITDQYACCRWTQIFKLKDTEWFLLPMTQFYGHCKIREK